FDRHTFLVVGQAPLVVLDLAGLELMLAAGTAPFGGAVVVLNTAGAVGDLWMTMVLLQVPSWVHVEDSGLGFLAWAPPAHGEEADRRRPPTGLDVPVLRWVGPWLLATMLAGTPSPFVLLSLAARRHGTQIRVRPMVLA